MGTGFVLLALCAVAVLVWRKRDAVSLNPESISYQAAVLSASPILQKALTAAAGRSDVQLKAGLRDLATASHVQSGRKVSEFFIETAASNEGKEQLLRDTNGFPLVESKATQGLVRVCSSSTAGRSDCGIGKSHSTSQTSTTA